jgi:hypothetical protein
MAFPQEAICAYNRSVGPLELCKTGISLHHMNVICDRSRKR